MPTISRTYNSFAEKNIEAQKMILIRNFIETISINMPIISGTIATNAKSNEIGKSCVVEVLRIP